MPPTSINKILPDLLEIAESAARSAANHILDSDPSSIRKKGRTDLVTAIDTESEEIICGLLMKETTNFGILAEERPEFNTDAEWVWVIDPLDGTTNFVHGYPSFGVSIACMQNGNPMLGVVVELPAENVYSAIKGNGAFRNGDSINVSKTNTIENALFVTGFGYDHDEAWETNMTLFKQFTNQSQGVRRLGAASVDLCHVANGKVDGFWEFDLHPWDTAAGIIIVEEAGGTVSQMDDEPFSIFNRNIVASNGILHNQITVQTRPVLEKLRLKGIDI